MAAKNRNCILYILHCFNENENFIKIGITSRSIKQRYPNKKSMPYSFKILKEIKDLPEKIWELENTLKKNLKVFHYSPELNFNGGYTECFTVEVLNEPFLKPFLIDSSLSN